MHQVPRPPAARYVAKNEAAAQIGVKPRALLAIIESDPAIRTCRLGARQLLHVAAEDVANIAARLAAGGAR